MTFTKEEFTGNNRCVDKGGIYDKILEIWTKRHGTLRVMRVVLFRCG